MDPLLNWRQSDATGTVGTTTLMRGRYCVNLQVRDIMPRSIPPQVWDTPGFRPEELLPVTFERMTAVMLIASAEGVAASPRERPYAFLDPVVPYLRVARK